MKYNNFEQFSVDETKVKKASEIKPFLFSNPFTGIFFFSLDIPETKNIMPISKYQLKFDISFWKEKSQGCPFLFFKWNNNKNFGRHLVFSTYQVFSHRRLPNEKNNWGQSSIYLFFLSFQITCTFQYILCFLMYCIKYK